MVKGRFASCGVFEGTPRWRRGVSRLEKLYDRTDDVRSDFNRDYNRILHSGAYRRLKHKTQVFFATRNDHICTRVEHVNHVSAVSYSISNHLGLNPELTMAIAIGHDLGHPPFGHSGEAILRKVAMAELGESFWHEKNGLRTVDRLETLEGPDGRERGLNLTYAVRDGIISHCGEVNENAIFPRDEAIDLDSIKKPSEYAPFTWEGCIVKISDKISYLGRDIEDALELGILSPSQIRELGGIMKIRRTGGRAKINNTVLMYEFIVDLCRQSTPERGIRFAPKYLELINTVKDFNYRNIYFHRRLANYVKYAELVLETVYGSLMELYESGDVLRGLEKASKHYPQLHRTFSEWLLKYSDASGKKGRPEKYANRLIYRLADRKDYVRAAIDYISCMTDHFALSLFNELISF